MDDLRVLFVHQEEEECDSFRRACFDEDFKVDTVPNLFEARKQLEEYSYEMVFVNRRFEAEDLIDFINEWNQKSPDTECVMGVTTLTKGDLIHYQNSDVSYRMYIEPANYRLDLLPFIQNTMLDARARIMGELDAGAKRKEKAYHEAQALLLSLLPDPESEEGSYFVKEVLMKYHQISMNTISRVSEFKDEMKELFRSGSKVTINWNVKENAIRILEYVDATQKMNMARIMTMIALEEAEALGGGYQVTSTVNMEGNRDGIRLTVQSMITSKPGASGNEYSPRNKNILNEMNGICDELCSNYSASDEFPAGMWMHTRDVIFDA